MPCHLPLITKPLPSATYDTKPVICHLKHATFNLSFISNNLISATYATNRLILCHSLNDRSIYPHEWLPEIQNPKKKKIGFSIARTKLVDKRNLITTSLILVDFWLSNPFCFGYFLIGSIWKKFKVRVIWDYWTTWESCDVLAPYDNWIMSKSDNSLPVGLCRGHIQDIMLRN